MAFRYSKNWDLSKLKVAQGKERSINVVDYKGKVELDDSVRYREGMDERESFATFKDWVLSSSAEELQSRIRRPLLPATNPQEER